MSLISQIKAIFYNVDVEFCEVITIKESKYYFVTIQDNNYNAEYLIEYKNNKFFIVCKKDDDFDDEFFIKNSELITDNL